MAPASCLLQQPLPLQTVDRSAHQESQMYDLVAAVSALSSDILSAHQFPPANTAGAGAPSVLQHVLTRRLEAGRDVLLEELSRGERALNSRKPDDLVSILYCYLRAAQEGAARINLRLMARVIAGQAIQGALYADDFFREAGALASLTRSEITLLAAMAKTIMADGWLSVWTAGPALIPLVFPTNEAFLDACAPLVRTGYIRPISAMDGMMDYKITAAFERLAALVRFEEWDPGKEPDAAGARGRGTVT